jgi:phosphonopyruvate decarboxylase
VSIDVDDFLTPVKEAGFDFFSGVPCSFLTPVINRVIGDDSLSYVGAASEGEAVAIASGAWLAGHKTVVMCQNSGLGNAVNPLTSLNFPFRIPSLMIVTWRGGPGLTDEPQHELMGEITPSLLDIIQVPNGAFPASQSDVTDALSKAYGSMDANNLPYAFIMQKGDVNKSELDAKAPPPAPKGKVESRRENGTDAFCSTEQCGAYCHHRVYRARIIYARRSASAPLSSWLDGVCCTDGSGCCLKRR